MDEFAVHIANLAVVFYNEITACINQKEESYEKGIIHRF